MPPVDTSLLPQWVQVLLAILAVVVPAVTWLFKAYLGPLMRERIKSVALANASVAALSAVCDVGQTVVDGLKAASADGKLTDVEKKEVAKIALNRFFELVKWEDWRKLFDTEASAKAAAASLIEKAVVTKAVAMEPAKQDPSPPSGPTP